LTAGEWVPVSWTWNKLDVGPCPENLVVRLMVGITVINKVPETARGSLEAPSGVRPANRPVLLDRITRIIPIEPRANPPHPTILPCLPGR
jgi:hypothetical protein